MRCDYGDPCCECQDPGGKCQYVAEAGRPALFVPPAFVDQLRGRFYTEAADQRRALEAEFKARRQKDWDEITRLRSRLAAVKSYADDLRVDAGPSLGLQRWQNAVAESLQILLSDRAPLNDLDRED